MHRGTRDRSSACPARIANMCTCVLMHATNWPRGLHTPGRLMQATNCLALHAYKFRQHHIRTDYKNTVRACICCKKNITDCVPRSQQPRAEVIFLGRAAGTASQRTGVSSARRSCSAATPSGLGRQWTAVPSRTRPSRWLPPSPGNPSAAPPTILATERNPTAGAHLPS